MDMKKIFDEVVPHDDLHWFEEEGKRTAISPEELDGIVEACFLGGADTDEEALLATRWAEQARMDNIILNGIMAKRLAITGFDEKGSLCVVPIPEMPEIPEVEEN